MEEIQKQYCIEVLLSLSNATNTVGEKTHTHTHREWPRWGERCGGAPSSSPSRATTKISCFIPQKPTVHRKISSRRSRIIREQKWEKHAREHSEDRSEPSFYSIFPGNDQYRFPSVNSPPIIPWRGILNLT